MTSSRNNSIAQKLTYTIAITAIIVLTISGIAWLTSQFYSSRAAVTHELSSLAKVSNFAVAPAMLFGDHPAAQKILQGLKTQPDLLTAELYVNETDTPFAAFTLDKPAGAFIAGDGKDAAILTGTGTAFAQHNANQESCSEATFTRQQVILCTPVEMDGDILGRLYLQADLSRLYQELGYTLALFLGVLPVVCLLALLAAQRLGKVIARPIRHLADIATLISHDENFALRAKKYTDDEVGQLTECFNAMLEQIQLRDKQLNAHSWELEQKIAERTAHLRIAAIAFETQEGLMVTGHNKAVLRINQAFTSIYGYSQEDLIGTIPSIFRSEYQDTEFYQALWKKMRLDRFWSGEIQDRRKNNEKFTAWVTITAVIGEDGNVNNYVSSISDISEYIRIKEELRKHRDHLQVLVEEKTEDLRVSEGRLQAVLNTVVDGIITLNECGIIETVNPAAERIFGYTATEVIGQYVKLLMPELYYSYLEHYHTTDEAHIIGLGRELMGLHKDGSVFPLEISVSEMWQDEGHHFTGIVRDITERKQIELQLVAAKDQAQQASAAKSAFLAAMSHEIRTPMNGVIGMVDVLRQTNLQSNQVEMVDLIRESAYSLLGIINDILDFSKIEAGKLEIESLPMSVANVVEQVCAMLDHLAEKKRVELTLFTDPALPAEVLGDAGRLRQVLVNLVNNAIKFSGGQERQGRVSVRAVLADDCKAATAPGGLAAFPPSMEVGSGDTPPMDGGGRATHGTVAKRNPERVAMEIRIADNGIGMDEATLSGLFAPFAQADTSTTRRFGGTGLGLAIAHHLVQLMGGEIAVQSVPGLGSTFTVRLSLVPLSASADAGLAESPVAGLSCLVVGESQGLTHDIAAYLAYGGATVERAPDLATARKRGGIARSVVWILDAAGAPPPLDELRAIARIRPEQEIRFVIIGRGQRRKARMEDTDVVLVDGNVLTRGAVLKAVAIAARRIQQEQATLRPGKTEAEFRPPSLAATLRQGRLILVAEDNETNQKVILRQLVLLGLSADVADDGRQALERWHSGDYALLLTDLNMPEMDGYELAAAVRAEEKASRRIPIVALTANALKDEAEHCRAVGMDDYLSKPVQLVQLKAMLEKWLPAAADEPSPDSEGTSCPFPFRGGSAVQNGTNPHGADLDARSAGRSPNHRDAVSNPAVLSPDSPAMPVDVSVLKALVGDDPAVVTEFLHDFRISATQTAVELKAACENGQAIQVGALAHKLKSPARSVGALALGELCAEIEQAGKAGQVEALIALLPRFEAEMAAVAAYLETI